MQCAVHSNRKGSHLTRVQWWGSLLILRKYKALEMQRWKPNHHREVSDKWGKVEWLTGMKHTCFLIHWYNYQQSQVNKIWNCLEEQISRISLHSLETYLEVRCQAVVWWISFAMQLLYFKNEKSTGNVILSQIFWLKLSINLTDVLLWNL